MDGQIRAMLGKLLNKALRLVTRCPCKPLHRPFCLTVDLGNNEYVPDTRICSFARLSCRQSGVLSRLSMAMSNEICKSSISPDVEGGSDISDGAICPPLAVAKHNCQDRGSPSSYNDGCQKNGQNLQQGEFTTCASQLISGGYCGTPQLDHA